MKAKKLQCKKSDGDPQNISNENSHVAKDVVNKEETTEDEAKAGQLPEDIQQKSLLQNFEEQESDMLNQDLAETLQLDKQEVLEDDANFNSDKSIGKFSKIVNKLELSTNSLSYERFFPGRVLGNTFVAKNNSSELIKLAISFDNSKINNHYVADKLCEHYSCDSVNEMEDPYSKHMLQEVDTTKEVLDVWHLEDPYTKKLSQFVEFELEPNSEQEFIIVLKSPANNQQIMYAADVVLHQIENGFKDSVFCFGFLEQLKISIPKEMYNTKLNARIVKIVLQRKQKAQSIKLLLENKGDMSVITNFQSIELEENLQFCLPKNKLSLEPKSKALLEIKALYKPINQPRQQNAKPEVIHKLVVSKVKDCELKFSIVFEITIL
ncbi:unnamed protein product [Moneuplotes crassus]|uniref:Uncharacterized protein n=1 Tax=Euplotes crassus TaxID=5936 RepID=A0AAD1UED2_EUPCR|nr:unnamed protein product [Moneuplotes crassus]